MHFSAECGCVLRGRWQVQWVLHEELDALLSNRHLKL